MDLTKNKDKVRFFYYFICLFLVRPVYIVLMRNIAEATGFQTTATTYLYYAIMWATLAVGILGCRAEFRTRFVVFLFISVLVISISCLAFDYSIDYVAPKKFWQNLWTFTGNALLNSFLFIIIGALVTDYEFLLKCMVKTARIAMIVIAVIDILSIIILQNKRYDDMAYAYGICLLVCTVLFSFLQNRKPIDAVLSVVGSVSITLCGTRGPIIGVLCLFVLWAFLYQKEARLRVIAIIVLTLVVVLFYSGIIEGLAQSISMKLESWGLPHFRIFDMLRRKNLSDDSGRNKIYDAIIQGIKERPLVGYGIGGDRQLTHHAYAHNFFLEFFCHFGLFFGTVFMAAILRYFIMSVFDENRVFASLVLIFLTGCVSRLIVSSSYILLPEFFFLLGMILNRLKTEKELETARIPFRKKRFPEGNT